MDQPSQIGSQRRSSGMRWWVLLLFALYLGGYLHGHRQEAAFSGRMRLIETGIEQELALGLQGFEQVRAEATLVEAGEEWVRLREVNRRLVEAAPALEQYLAERRGIAARTEWERYAWQVALIDSAEADAFALPGGKLVVHRGMLPLAPSVDALAALMSHEIAHLLLRHAAERAAQQKLVPVGAMADLDLRQRPLLMAALGAGTRFGTPLPFSREHEAEADHVALMLAATACYRPEAALGLWQRIGERVAAKAPREFISTHAASSKRIRRLHGWMDEANQIRAQFCGNR